MARLERAAGRDAREAKFGYHSGDGSLLPSGHDAWTAGEEPAVYDEFQGMLDDAKAREPGLRCTNASKTHERPAQGDGATVPVCCQSPLAELDLPEKLELQIDLEFDEAAGGEEIERKGKLKTSEHASKQRSASRSGRRSLPGTSSSIASGGSRR